MSGKYKKLSAIYGIFCKSTGKTYVGSSNRVGLRRWKHFDALNKGTHHSIKLQRAWNKHTPSVFVFSILEICSEESLLEREQFYIDAWDSYNNGYNSNPIARSSRGSKRSPETLAKFKATMYERYGGSPNKGKKATEETKRLIRLARSKQKPPTLKRSIRPEQKEMLRQARIGSRWSVQQREKFSKFWEIPSNVEAHSRKTKEGMAKWKIKTS